MSFLAMRRCPGCAVRRSPAQFIRGQEFCELCRKAGVKEPISTRRQPVQPPAAQS